MDTLNTVGMSPEFINQEIEITEAKYPSRKRENDIWRKWLLVPENSERLRRLYPSLSIEAGFLSTCRSDMLNCGSCALGAAIFKLDARVYEPRLL